MTEGVVNASRVDGVGWIEFENPDRRNAVTTNMWRQCTAAITKLESDPLVRVIALRGKGEKAFVAGADLAEVEQGGAALSEALSVSDEALSRLQHCDKPTVACIKGFCIGGGISIAMSCNIRIASSSAVVGIPASRLGLGYSLRSTELLVRNVGLANAAEMLFSGSTYSAEEAFALGILQRTFEESQFDRKAEAYLGRMASNAPLSLRAAVFSLRAIATGDMQSRLQATDAIERCTASSDFSEGRKAHKEKRSPIFMGT
jgi:enoyl-CoA hydratase